MSEVTMAGKDGVGGGTSDGSDGAGGSGGASAKSDGDAPVSAGGSGASGAAEDEAELDELGAVIVGGGVGPAGAASVRVPGRARGKCTPWVVTNGRDARAEHSADGSWARMIRGRSAIVAWVCRMLMRWRWMEWTVCNER